MKKAFNFFLLFAQCECALKMIGFHHGDGTEAKPNWDNFINAIRSQFDYTDPKISNAVQYLEQQPPMKQWIRNNTLVWEPANQTGNRLNDLFLSIRRVRNNLFHGGKFNGVYLEAPERSNELFDSCIAILKYCREIYPAISPN